MPRWLQFILNNPQFLLFAAFVIVPLLKTLLKVLATTKQRKDAMDRMASREIDAIRTGRAVEAGSEATNVSARRQLEAMAAQRREAATRRAPEAPARRAAPPPLRPAPPPETTTQVRLPGGLVLEIPTAEPAPRPAAPSAARPGRGAAQRRGPERSRRPEGAPEPSARTRGVPATPEPPPMPSAPTGAARASVRAWLLGAAMTRTDWRRAIVVNEVLGPPVTLR